MSEIWKVCVLSKRYEVSNFGNVRYKGNKKLRPQRICNTGYKMFEIKENVRNRKLVKTHRAIMLTFKPDEHFEGAEVNHINGIKTDNRLENLEWCTHEENNRHALYLMKLRKEIHNE